MNKIMEDMRREEFLSVFTKELFNKIDEMIEEKKIRMENVRMLIKRVAYWIELKNAWYYSFEFSELSQRIREMIVEEDWKKEKKDEKLLIDLCKWCLSVSFSTSSKLISICLPCIMKAASNKEENEEAKEEVEMALLALNGYGYCEISEELYLNEIKDIIQHHQEHHNLTRLAYQSAWQFLMNRFDKDKNLEAVIVNELHFVREAIKELEELTRNVNWKKEKEEERRGKEAKEEIVILRWFDIIMENISQCKLRNEEFIRFIGSIVELYRAAKDIHRGICGECIDFLRFAARSEPVKNDDLLKGGAIDVVFEELYQPTLEDENVRYCLDTVLAISGRLEGKTDDEMEEVKRKEMNRKVFEKMEEEGHEDTIASFYGTIDFQNANFHLMLSLNISDYFVNI
ncbi:uncharacterized protein MONOS_13058 [Monocercomonoides exilis]|uniref:uncharacterized protein n=1 Tax=Monocercomonoides exilis TaxID=2049356 RepID=UPI0035596D88|nr:hypothetical protein MONOS_13058 [Monocercomonoides exilis]|eukprot:MONOS_13058.1-p1 / transcript=MONOS_13058.1 / gene=MONOS_13058 / organism=Monocercomonoides_exilis_PA203 / gene_product=unspecified product / transcript_product=unspecified product / location=Mono_scaffold00772:22724-23986(+) / protein_length=399 / sequence_SO=supercontig / SO=protein_coding / is_pseudo=false